MGRGERMCVMAQPEIYRQQEYAALNRVHGCKTARHLYLHLHLVTKVSVRFVLTPLH